MEAFVVDIAEILEEKGNKHGLDVSNVGGFNESVFANLDKSFIYDLKDVMSLKHMNSNEINLTGSIPLQLNI
jgi:hypothetical protein